MASTSSAPRRSWSLNSSSIPYRPLFCHSSAGCDHRHQHLQAADGVHLLANDLLGLSVRPQPGGHPRPHARPQLADQPGAHHQLVRGGLGVGRSLLLGGQQVAGQARHGPRSLWAAPVLQMRPWAADSTLERMAPIAPTVPVRHPRAASAVLALAWAAYAFQALAGAPAARRGGSSTLRLRRASCWAPRLLCLARGALVPERARALADAWALGLLAWTAGEIYYDLLPRPTRCRSLRWPTSATWPSTPPATWPWCCCCARRSASFRRSLWLDGAIVGAGCGRPRRGAAGRADHRRQRRTATSWPWPPTWPTRSATWCCWRWSSACSG